MSEIIAGTYELKNKIGSGGGGVVYLAEHLRLGKKVVLKADKRKITTRPEILRREVDALKDLKHTYIPQVYDFFVEDETVYTVIDYVEGESLDKPLKRGEKFSQPQVIKWACELLEALCYLHNPVHGTPPKGIVHSDIKPANIMFKPDGDICLIDFNIALALGEENVVGLSAGYASPEQYGLDFSTDSVFTESSKSKKKSTKNKMITVNDTAETITMKNIAETKTLKMPTSEQSKSGSKYSSSLKKIIVPDARSDIYSLGATLYHLLSGKRPHKNAVEVESLSGDDFSPIIVKIIAKAMNPNPDLRYQSAEEMLYDFTHLRENDPRTKKRKKIIVSASVFFSLFLVGGIFTSFVGLSRMETMQKSLAFAEYSQNALESGDVDLAIKYALDALPEEGLLNSPYTAQAKKALADSLGVYDLSDGFKPHKIVELPSETLKIALSPDGKTGAAVYSSATAVFSSETGEITATLPTVKSALSDIKYVNNDVIVYAGEKGITAYNIKTNNEIWKGKPATHIAISSDGQTVAGIYRDEDFATVYDINGNIKATVSFKGNKQHILENDTFSDPEYNLMTLSANGQYLAVNFENGGLRIYNMEDLENDIEIYDKSDFNHFEGGFCGKYFAYTASDTKGISEFAIIDISELVQTVGADLDYHMDILVNEKNIYLCDKNTVVSINPITGEQKETAYTDSDITVFANDGVNTIAATKKNNFVFFDEKASKTEEYNMGQVACNFVDISKDYAVVAGNDTRVIRVLKRKQYESANTYSYDEKYVYDEARINKDESKIMLFSYKGFRICDIDGKVIKDVPIPNPEKVFDQQYIKNSGNLAVMYKDAFRLYSGETGDLLYEEEDLKSVLYTPYGVNVFNGTDIKLIDLDSGKILESGKGNGNFGAYCGIFVDEKFLDGGTLIGAGKIKENYYFAVLKDEICIIYDGKGEKLFEVSAEKQSETFFIDTKVIISPLHGTPVVYSLETGQKISDLEKDAYLTYVTKLNDYIIGEYYLSVSDERYGILMDKNTFETLAYLPDLTDIDINNNELIFDFHKGTLRRSRIYPINELINIAKEGDMD